MIYSAILFGLWLLLMQDTSMHSIIIGVAIVGAIGFVARYMGVVLTFNWRIILYIPWLLKEVWISTIAVVKIIWNPKMHINQGFKNIKTLQTTEAGMVLYANSITLTPGTYTVDMGEGSILVHSLVRQDVWSSEMDGRILGVLK